MASAALYGGTFTLLDVSLRRLGIETTFVAPDDPEAFANAARPETKAFFTEIVANPAGVVADLEGLSAAAHTVGVPLVVDSTVATPHLCRPFEHGADIVIHSATKFIGGHGTSMGGVVVESGRFDWSNGRFPRMTEPVESYGGLRYWDNFGEYGFCTQLRVEQLRDFGACLAPFNAFLLLQGLETLSLRMDAHVANARGLAEFLNDHPAVDWVTYAGLEASPYHELALRYLPRGPGAVFSFGVSGGRRAAEAFVESVELASHLANIGDTRTLVIHPASTTHRQLSDDALVARRRPDLVRVSVGIEDLEDIVWDFDQCVAGRHQGTMTRPEAEHGPWQPPSARERLEILEATHTIAIVGASSNPARASHFVATYLLSSSTDYEVWFVNPARNEILGRPVYPSLSDLPTPLTWSTCSAVLRVPVVATEAVAVGARTFWAQLGLLQ